MELGKRAPAAPDEPALMNATDIQAAGDLWEFVKQASGQTLGSWGAAGVYGGLPGATGALALALQQAHRLAALALLPARSVAR